MKSTRTKAFRELFAKLPSDVQKQAYAAYNIFKVNPYHPSLHFKCVNKEESWYSVRINKSYRAVGIWKGIPFPGFLSERMRSMTTFCDGVEVFVMACSKPMLLSTHRLYAQQKNP